MDKRGYTDARCCSLTRELPLIVDQALVTAGLKTKPGPWTLATVRPRRAGAQEDRDHVA